MRDLALGRYVPYESFIHHLDARTKVFCLILLMVPLFLGYGSISMGFLMLGVSALVIFGLMIDARVSFLSLLRSLVSLWFMLLILLLFYCLVPSHEGTVLFHIGELPIYLESILDALRIFLRLFLMIALTMVLTGCTKPLDMTYALEWYLTPFKYIGFPSHELAMVTSLALRFIPTITGDVKRIMDAQRSRGVDFRHGKISNRVRAIVSLIVPLFVSAFMRSEELSDAMSARGYDPRGVRTRYKKMVFSYRDLIALVFSLAFLAGAIYLSVTGTDLFALMGASAI